MVDKWNSHRLATELPKLTASKDVMTNPTATRRLNSLRVTAVFFFFFDFLSKVKISSFKLDFKCLSCFSVSEASQLVVSSNTKSSILQEGDQNSQNLIFYFFSIFLFGFLEILRKGRCRHTAHLLA